MAKACQNVAMLSMFIPLTTSARISAPIAVPTMPPAPPKSEVPPRHTAAIAVSSSSSPVPESAAFTRAMTTRPAKAASTPESAYTVTRWRFTGMPVSLAATALPPMA